MKDTGRIYAIRRKQLFKPAMINGPGSKNAQLFAAEVAALLSIDLLRKLEATTGIEAQFIYARGCNPGRRTLEIIQQKGIN